MTPEFIILPAQYEFYSSLTTHTAYIGGFRSGKSYIGTFKTIIKKIENKGVNVAYYLPTYGLVADVAYPLFKTHLDHMGIKYTLNMQRHEIVLPGRGKIIMRSMDDPNSIIGYEVGYSCMDEIDVMPQHKAQNAFVKIIARNSAKTKNGVNSTDLVSTPEGYGFAYTFFKKDSKPNRKLIQVKTKDNPYLADGYIDTLTETYTAEQLSAYLDGQFVNLTSGSVYRNFSRTNNHTDRGIKTGEVLHIGMDFNITNMSAVVHVIEGGIKYAVAELTNIYDTAAMIRIIQDKYQDHKIVVYPDASGKNRNTSGLSDVLMLQQAGFNIRVGNKNPFVRDRINAMNTAFYNETKGIKYYVNTFNCPEYTAALEQIAYKNGEPDKQSGLDHITDGGGYFIYQCQIVSFTI